MEWLCGGVVLFVLLALISGCVQADKVARAKAAYQSSLEQLKKDPTNASLREQTLALGRQYSALARDQKLVTIYDEVAIANDINAACASAPAHPPAGSTGVPANESIEARLEKLESLRQRGLISEPEYQHQREKILDDI